MDNPVPADTKVFRILIVDDVAKNIQVAANILKDEGYQLAFAQSGKAALDQLNNTRFDLVLLDIMMPEIDGFQVCEQIRKDASTRNIPVIFLTAKTDTESIVKGFELGAMDYVTKPFNGTELLARVRTHLLFNHTREQLREANVTKDKFFSIIAHDLKNPFNTLINLSKMLLKKHETMEDCKVTENLDLIYESSRKTYQLLENLLDWSRIQTGRIKWNPMEIGLSALAFESVSIFRNAALKKEITLESNIEPDETAFADPNMITLVIRNLVSNAIKFTEKGGKVTIASQPEGDFQTITVTDTGVGMTDEEREKLFRIDVHHSKPGTDNEEGTGLGLILCREFVEKNGGKIGVNSRPGSGSTFYFKIPGKCPQIDRK